MNIKTLSHYRYKQLPITQPAAAVMIILLIGSTNQVEILLTKRATTLLNYAGHYSFPGGMQDAHDKDLYATAIREVQEELYLSPDTYQYVSQLDDFMDRTGHLVRPFVVKMPKEVFEKAYKLSIDEIDDIYYFSLTKLDQIKDDPQLHDITKRRPSYAFSEGEVFIWGLTATILVHLSNIITGETKPLGKTIAEA
ncbi:MAG: CoA pyrophosphatase [Gammaproteobacteria bacterium]|nr:MAG: CoA pyrophosphatase [Gammaproteobacteria bacterium]